MLLPHWLRYSGGNPSWPSLKETHRASTQQLVDELAAVYKNRMEGSVSAEEFCQADVLTRIKELLMAKTKSLKSVKTATH